jgi:hypothetical protein
VKSDFFTTEQLRMIARYPHLIGHMVGKDKLTPMHSRWISMLWDPEEHTSLMAHRGSYKTTALTEVGCVFYLLFHPDARICLVRETWTAANDTLKTISNYMQTELVQELFRAMHDNYPLATTDRDGRLTYAFKRSITKEGSIDAYGVGTVPTGSHYDVVLVDDAISINDRFSRAKRERTAENLMEIKMNILDPGKFMRCVGTPWHKDDAWKILPRPHKFDVYATGILTTAQIEEKKAEMTGPMFAANYELEHTAAEDMMFIDPEFGDWVPSPQRVVAHLDAAYGGRDTNALTIMQRRNDGGIQAYGKIFTGHVAKRIDEIQRVCELRGARLLMMESNSDHGFSADLLKRFGSEDGMVLRTQTYAEKMDKHVKIGSYLGKHWHDLVWDNRTDNDYMSQVTDYMEDASPDDAPDSAASLLKEFFFKGGSNNAAKKALYS